MKGADIMVISANESFADKTFNMYPQLQEAFDKIRLLEPLITSEIARTSNMIGASLTGLQYSVKTASSIEDNIHRRCSSHDISPEESFDSLIDIIRYTQITEHDDIFKTAQNTISELQKKGFFLDRVKNYYKNPYSNTGYKGLHLGFISPQGQLFELQIHSEKSYSVKQQGHDLYERMRAISTPIEKKEEIKVLINKIHSSVKNPPGYTELDNFKAKKKDIEAFKQGLRKISIDIERPQDGCIAYSITDSINGSNIITGIENTHSDGSVIAVRAEKIDTYASSVSYDQFGHVTNSTTIPSYLLYSIKPNELEDIKNIMEFTSSKWIQQYDNAEPNVVTNMINDRTKNLLSMIQGIHNGDDIICSIAKGDENSLKTALKTEIEGYVKSKTGDKAQSRKIIHNEER